MIQTPLAVALFSLGFAQTERGQWRIGFQELGLNPSGNALCFGVKIRHRSVREMGAGRTGQPVPSGAHEKERLAAIMMILRQRLKRETLIGHCHAEVRHAGHGHVVHLNRLERPIVLSRFAVFV